jgi:hypothetical protein
VFTVFHVAELVGAVFGVAIGWMIGRSEFGWVGGLGGALLGAPLGWLGGRVPYLIARLLLHVTLSRESKDQLRARLRDGVMWSLYQDVMKELRRRGEDVRGELPLVLTLLTADWGAQRHRGWYMLRCSFPDLAAQIPDYDPTHTAAQCRAKTESLRPAKNRPVS